MVATCTHECPNCRERQPARTWTTPPVGQERASQRFECCVCRALTLVRFDPKVPGAFDVSYEWPDQG